MGIYMESNSLFPVSKTGKGAYSIKSVSFNLSVFIVLLIRRLWYPSIC